VIAAGAFFSETAPMWFSKSATVEIEPEPALTAEQHYEQVNSTWRSAEERFNHAYAALVDYSRRNPDARATVLNGKLFCRVNAVAMDLTRQKLEAAVGQAFESRNKLLKERAELKLALGL
jgi:hypothetical protein